MLPENTEQRSALLESALEQTQEGVLVTEGAPLDAPGPRIIYVNPAFTEITGYQAEELIGENPRLLQGPATEPWVLQRLRNCLEQGRSFEGEAINYRKDGTPYLNQWSISPVRNSDGIITHWVSVQRDVTDRRLTNERLLMAQERERHRLGHQMHEELGGHLTALQMAIDRARQDTAGSPHFQEIEEQVEVLTNIVRRRTEEAAPRVLTDYGLAEALPQLVETLETEYELSIDLSTELKPERPISPLLGRVVYRIVRESLLTLRSHADRVSLRLKTIDGQLQMKVIDHGSALDPARDRQRDRDHHLSGIKERVEKLNGSFLVESNGEDTRLTVRLPLRLVSPTEALSFPLNR